MLNKLTFWIEDNILSRFTWWREATDVEIHCRECGAFIGLVWKQGHNQWLCGRCAGTTEPKAV